MKINYTIIVYCKGCLQKKVQMHSCNFKVTHVHFSLKVV
jgi:hypothetical protein